MKETKDLQISSQEVGRGAVQWVNFSFGTGKMPLKRKDCIYP